MEKELNSDLKLRKDNLTLKEQIINLQNTIKQMKFDLSIKERKDRRNNPDSSEDIMSSNKNQPTVYNTSISPKKKEKTKKTVGKQTIDKKRNTSKGLDKIMRVRSLRNDKEEINQKIIREINKTRIENNKLKEQLANELIINSKYREFTMSFIQLYRYF